MASRTYSFKDSTFAFAHPVANDFVSAGEVGLGQMTVTMAAERTTHDRAADGTIMPSYIAGDDGACSIEVQQTSEIHAFLLAWYNLIKTAANNGDVSNWATAVVTIRNLTDGGEHILSGVSPSKVPDKTYAAAGGKVTWVLMATDVQSTVLS